MELRVKRLTPAGILPAAAHPTDAGLDLHAAIDVEIGPGEAKLVPTGIAIELPAGTEAQIRPRSGLAKDFLVTVLNTPGTLDEGYRGEVGVLLINHGRETFLVSAGMRVAQLVIQLRCEVEVIAVDVLTDTDRGSGGFGSTRR